MTEQKTTNTNKKPKSSKKSARRPYSPPRPKSKASPKPVTRNKNPAARTDALRLVPVGGLEEIGRNMSFLEYKDEISQQQNTYLFIANGEFIIFQKQALENNIKVVIMFLEFGPLMGVQNVFEHEIVDVKFFSNLFDDIDVG